MECLRSAIRTPDRLVFIIPDGLELQRITEIFELSRQATQSPPVLLQQRVFRHLVRHYDPFEYSRMYRNRTIVFGGDPLAEINPPGRPEFTARALDMLSNVLRFRRSERLYSSCSNWLPHFETELGRAMAVQLLCRSGWISAHQGDIAARWREEFPDHARLSEQIKRDATMDRDESARRAAFDLFRSIVGDFLAEPALQAP
jgi:hypothetical protein